MSQVAIFSSSCTEACRNNDNKNNDNKKNDNNNNDINTNSNNNNNINNNLSRAGVAVLEAGLGQTIILAAVVITIIPVVVATATVVVTVAVTVTVVGVVAVVVEVVVVVVVVVVMVVAGLRQSDRLAVAHAAELRHAVDRGHPRQWIEVLKQHPTRQWQRGKEV